MTIESLNKRIESASTKVAKLEKKLAKMYELKARDWEEPNPYCYGPSDLRYAEEDLAEARQTLAKYQEALTAETEKAQSRNVQVIIDFLEDWKAKVKAWYMEAITAHEADKKALDELRRNGSDEEYNAFATAYSAKIRGYYEEREVEEYHFFRSEGRSVLTTVKKRVKVRNGEWEYASRYIHMALKEAESLLDKDLQAEADAKYDDIINRTQRIVGVITDASHLTVGAKGDLNGYIIGTKGNAKVHTIGAGGYAVQCYHFRTLIHKM